MTPEEGLGRVEGTLAALGYGTSRVNDTVLRLDDDTGGEPVFVSFSDTDESPEVLELEDMLSTLKGLEEKTVDPPAIIKIIAERRQLVKQISILRAQINARRGAEKGKLAGLREGSGEEGGKAW